MRPCNGFSVAKIVFFSNTASVKARNILFYTPKVPVLLPKTGTFALRNRHFYNTLAAKQLRAGLGLVSPLLAYRLPSAARLLADKAAADTINSGKRR